MRRLGEFVQERLRLFYAAMSASRSAMGTYSTLWIVTSERNGTTTLFAALNVLTGVVTGQCFDRHRLVAPIDEYFQASNDNPKPFVWTASAESILEKVRRGRVARAEV